MTITYRLEKGSPLTYAELDDNFRTIAGVSNFGRAFYATKSEADANVSMIAEGTTVQIDSDEQAAAPYTGFETTRVKVSGILGPETPTPGSIARLRGRVYAATKALADTYATDFPDGTVFEIAADEEAPAPYTNESTLRTVTAGILGAATSSEPNQSFIVRNLYAPYATLAAASAAAAAGQIPEGFDVRIASDSGAGGAPTIRTNTGGVLGPATPAEQIRVDLSTATAGSGADLVANAPRIVKTIADLLALDYGANVAGRNREVSVLSYWSGFPSSAQIYEWDGASTEASDGGSVLVPLTNPATGRWKLRTPGPVRLRQFGVIGDGTERSLSTQFATLAAAQARYPNAVSLTQQIDSVAAQAALAYAGIKGRVVETEQATIRTSETLVLPYGIEIRGDGMNENISGTDYPTTWIRAASSFTNGDILRVAGNLFGTRRFWSGKIRRLSVRGNLSATSQRGISFRDAAGNIVAAQDTTVLEDLLIRSCASGGIELPDAGLPVTLNRIKCLHNNGPGVEITGGTNLHQSINITDLSGDGNNGGLLRCNNLDKQGSVTIVNLKSEMRANPEYGSVTRQNNAIVFFNCDETPVTIVGATHISSVPNGANFDKPGDLIDFAGSAVAPRITWLGAAVRVRVGDIGSDPRILAFGGTVGVPYTRTAGHFMGASAAGTTQFPIVGFAGSRVPVGTNGAWLNAGPTDNGVQAQGNTPGFSWYETDAGADRKSWSMDASGGALRRRTITDAGTATTYETVQRSATGATALQWTVPVLPGAQTIANLPAASDHSNEITMVTNPAANKGRLVYSDGSVWRYVSDDSAV